MGSILQEERDFQDELEGLDIDTYRERVKQDVDDFISGSPSRSRGSQSVSPARRNEDVRSPSKSPAQSPAKGPSKDEAKIREQMLKIKKGDRVQRNAEHWQWGDQDGGEGSYGTVQIVDVENGWITVLWDNGASDNFRHGQEKDGVTAWDVKAAPNAPPASAAQGGRQEAAADAATAKQQAEVLYKAVKGLGTDEDAIFNTLNEVNTQAEWDEVKKQFKAAHPEFDGGDLLKALDDDLNKKEMERVKEVLRSKNVSL